jgi:hypothetical protein
MTAFRFIAGIVIAALLAGIGYDLRRRMKSWNAAGEFLSRRFRDIRHGRETAGALSRARNIVAIVSGGLLLILALSGFLPVVFLGIHLSGVLLVIHVTAAPLFAIALSALALLHAHRLRFDESDLQFALGSGERDSHGKDALVRFALKAGFWLILTLSLPLMLTVILGLFPLFGTGGETMLIRLHGYSALLLLVSALGELYLIGAYMEHTTEQPLKEQNP